MKLLPSFSIFFLLQALNSFTSGINIVLWDRESLDFISIWNSSFRNIAVKNHKASLSVERARLQGETLRIGYHSEVNLMSFENNGTKISGLLGDMWTMLSDFLNFTIKAVEIPESDFGSQSSESYTGLMGMLRRNEVDIVPRVAFYLNTVDVIDYSTPLWTHSFRVYVRPQFVSDDSWIFKIFPFPAWLLIIIFMTSFGFLGAFYDRLNNFRLHMFSFWHLLNEHYFYTFAAFCYQGSIPRHVERSRILTFTKRTCAWLIAMIFSATLFSSMTDKEMNLPFTSIDSLMTKTDYKLIVPSASLAFQKFQTYILKNYTNVKYRRRFRYADTAAEMYRRGCNETARTAIWEADDRHRASASRICTFIATEEVYFSTWITTGMTKGFQYKRPIDNGILKLLEVGLLAALKDRWLIRELAWPPDKFMVVGMKQVYIIFVVLSIGVIVSLTILTMEHIVVIHRRYHLRKKWNNQLRERAEGLKIALNHRNFFRNKNKIKRRNVFLT